MDSVAVIIVIVVAVIALAAAGQLLSSRAGQASLRKKEQELRDARAREEEREREQEAQREDARKEESALLEDAQKRMALAQESINQAHRKFRETHDELIASILQLAKEGCDEQFRQRFGITRPPNADAPEDDEEVQTYLREHYAELRDAALVQKAGEFMEAEVERRLAATPEKPGEENAEAPRGDKAAGDEGASTEQDETAVSEATPEPEAVEAEPSAESKPEVEAEVEIGDESKLEPKGENGDETDNNAEPASDVGADAENEAEADSDAEANAAQEARVREQMRKQVREDFDFESIKTYMLAAISARFDADGKPVGDLPWPAYTTPSPHGFGELCLAEGSPDYAQDAYRDFAWKMFHTGKRAEKPQRGEYSWPQSHELGDVDAGTCLETPFGPFTATGPEGPLPLRTLQHCAWIHHDLLHQGALLKPDGQESLMLNLEGLHKGDIITLSFSEESAIALEGAETTRLFINAVGAAGDAFVGLSASNPEAANPGDAPFELAKRSASGLVFRMTSDARRHDDDTFPQFMEIHLCWCQPPSPKPEKVVRHLAR